MTLALPTYDDVVAAAARIEGHAHRTPVLTSRTADAELGAQLFFKCENFQRMGAFKFRGAYNALARFDERQRRAGVVAFSSGNHAQAISLAATLLGMPAVIVMPHDAPTAKVAATEGYGGEVVRYDRYREDREAIGRRLAQERGMTLIPPYDHPDVIAGQGTAAKELFEEVGALDALFVLCLGGGGLLSGSALAARRWRPIAGLRRQAGPTTVAVVPQRPHRDHRDAAHDRRRRADAAPRRARSRSSGARRRPSHRERRRARRDDALSSRSG
jgi:threonine dehydratase